MMHDKKIYLDYAATTPLDPVVASKMAPFFDQQFGNPSSIHYYGQEAEAAVEKARERAASLLNCSTREVIFTSGGSESDNLALRGVAFAARQTRNANRILISPVEHHAVSRTANQLAEVFGFQLEYLPVDPYGMVDPDFLRSRLSSDVALVSIIYANNEIGSINDVKEIGSICRSFGVPFHTDAVQAAAYLSINVDNLNVDLMSLGSHKFYGPKGMGALYIRKGTPILPIQTGGGQEFGLRAGTHNVPYIVGFAEALEIAQREREQRAHRLEPIRNELIGWILEEIPQSQLTGHPVRRLPNHASFVFKHVDGNTLLMMLDIAGYACSSGSACKTGNPEPSEVLIAMGITREWSLGSLRVTLGTGTIPDHIKGLSKTLFKKITELRSENPTGY